MCPRTIAGSKEVSGSSERLNLERERTALAPKKFLSKSQ
jgi:hypothetical protein